MNPNYVYKKEKKIFWYGISMGISGGILGSMFSSLFIELLINEIKKYWWGTPLLWILFIIIYVSLMYLLYKIKVNLSKLK